MHTIDLSKYRTIVFDCDGVVLDSNQLKIQAYLDTALKFGASREQAQALVDYHILLGGISRYTKFEYFLREILQQEVTEQAMQQLFDDFGADVERLLSDCEIAPGLQRLRDATADATWLVISGGDQTELGKIFRKRGIDGLFDGGIYGSPDNKEQILARELASSLIKLPALFLGDSKYDHVASTGAGLEFIFLSDWTDFDGWQEYCHEHAITVLPRLDALNSNAGARAAAPSL